ncbi:hypothetical protein RhiJN_06474 [Ceratobasidium sp. AG-Ba]|nr:hypothetical protein RhiJN_06474 [Ceratobasidium sp. AG-Ba]
MLKTLKLRGIYMEFGFDIGELVILLPEIEVLVLESPPLNYNDLRKIATNLPALRFLSVPLSTIEFPELSANDSVVAQLPITIEFNNYPFHYSYNKKLIKKTAAFVHRMWPNVNFVSSKVSGHERLSSSAQLLNSEVARLRRHHATLSRRKN